MGVMGRISINFETDNAAFENPHEAPAILKSLAAEISYGSITPGSRGVIRDSNGASVGSWAWVDTTLTFNDFVVRTSALAARPGLRHGQAAFTVLAEMRPDLADGIATTLRDPFYDDNRLGDFYEWVEQNW